MTMDVGIIGLGLIGGSLAKSIKTNTEHRVYGYDLQDSVVKRAQLVEAIDGVLDDEKLAQCKIVLIALYPDQIEACLKEYADKFPVGSIVVDCGGIKRDICRLGQSLAANRGWTFCGGHPMAGIEKSGFAAARQSLFAKATMILVTHPDVKDLAWLTMLKRFFLSLGFGRIKIATPEEHDRIIAYTSQLAHVLSSAYVKSPSALVHTGFSAGSFKDMTRVATLVPDMWSQLFLQNREPLLRELNGLIERLTQYRDAIAQENREGLEMLLAEGRDVKAQVDALEKAAMAQLEAEKKL
ncbi:MAG: prephenate dehydrogenase [Victivallales bacterium]|nr:prephenate dehydrogenase [Victivallales bacterium]